MLTPGSGGVRDTSNVTRFGLHWGMSTQVSLRLNDDLVARIDELVSSGAVRSRAEIVESALDRELRRRLYERDAEIYRSGEPDPDLDALNAWMQARRSYPGLG